MDAYSLDLRLSIVRACEYWPETREDIADIFGVSRSFVQKLLSRWNAGLSIAPLPHGGGPAPLLDDEARRHLRQVLQDRPDASLAELRLDLRRHQRLSVSAATICRALQDLELPIKKSRSTPTSATRHESGPCGAGGGERRHRRQRSTSSFSMRVGPIRP